jgi:hypothetical protein
MTQTNTVTINLTPIFVLTAAVFVVLKLTGVVDWSWLWVFAPLWIPFALFLGFFLLFLLIALPMVALGKGKFTRRR